MEALSWGTKCGEDKIASFLAGLVLVTNRESAIRSVLVRSKRYATA